jgi:hypothetical protein
MSAAISIITGRRAGTALATETTQAYTSAGISRVTAHYSMTIASSAITRGTISPAVAISTNA